jgi:ComF family protein
MLFLKQVAGDLFNLLFPELCHSCGEQIVHGEEMICTHCLYDLPYTDFHTFSDNAVARLFWGRMMCSNAMAMLYFRKGTKAQNLIHRLKYKSQPGLGLFLGRLLGERLLASGNYMDPEMIIPVPLHARKERARGYNQSQSIADGMASVLGIPVANAQLIRHRETPSQTKKGRYHRFENMQSVFSVPNPENISYKHILLVDDIITTGSTLEACGTTLLKSGAAKLSIVAVAFTV